MLDSEQSPQANPARWSRTSSTASASISRCMVAGRMVVSNIERYGIEPPRCRVISTGSSGSPSLVGAPGDHGEGVHGGDAEPVQVAQQLVLAQGRAARPAP